MKPYKIHVQLANSEIARFHACTDGMPEYHAYGDTVGEAVGNLILSYASRMGYDLEIHPEAQKLMLKMLHRP